MARQHTLKLRELRSIRTRFAFILGTMAVVTLILVGYLVVRVHFLHETINWLDFFSLCFFGVASLALTIAQIALLRHLTVEAVQHIEDLTYTDDLTGLGNQRHIAKFLTEEFREAQLSRNPLSVLFFDLDGFKQINDTHGHGAGDLILRAVSHALKETLREPDFVVRAGGDEFLVVLPDTDSQCASVVAKRLADRINTITVTVNSVAIRGVTASIGISSYPVNALTPKSLIEDADRAMYAAKNSEKGSIVVSIARPAGPESKASARHITVFAEQIQNIVERKESGER